MDNGHTQSTNTSSDNLFFTSGQGVESVDVNNVNPEDNLNLENWGTPIRSQEDHRTIGGTTMATMGAQEQTQTPEIMGTPEPAPTEFMSTDINLPPPVAPNIPTNNPDRLVASEDPNMPPGLGEIVPLEMPQDATQEGNKTPDDANSIQPTTNPGEINLSSFRPNGDKISHEAIEATKRMISSLFENKIDPVTLKEQYGEACRAYQGKNQEEAAK